MSDGGNLQLGDIQKKQEALNKTGGINTSKSVFQTGEDSAQSAGTMTEQLANNGPVLQNRALIQNNIDLLRRPNQRDPVVKPAPEAAPVQKEIKQAEASEKRDVIRARPDLKVFSGDVMKKGAFTPQAKEASRHFMMQLKQWAGTFEDGGSGFYRDMGIQSVLDCLYVDGMSLRSFLKEQYAYKATGDHATDQLMVQNYVTLLAARGEHVITLARPTSNGSEAGVEFKNLEMDMTSVGSKEVSKASKLKERGNQVRNTMKKRMEQDMVEQTSMAFRKSKGYDMDGFRRIEGAGQDLKNAAGASKKTQEYKDFEESFKKYNYGLQKLGLKPERDDIDSKAASWLKKRCEDAIAMADSFLAQNGLDEETERAVKQAKKELETDLSLLNRSIDTKLADDAATMTLKSLLDSTKEPPAKGSEGDGPEGGGGDGGDAPEDGGDA
ncbi:MAG: hypothetical protein K6F35_03125 [Lachnospiraceae bacterium]|nr:hypothetical protein [Lachnospiraceae bacterium]